MPATYLPRQRRGLRVLGSAPYVRKRPMPATYQGILSNSVEGFKDMRMLVDWFFDLNELQPSQIRVLGAHETNDKQVADKKALYQWELGDNYPPHIKSVPESDRKGPFQIFQAKRFLDTLQLIYPWIPDLDGLSGLAPGVVSSVAALEDFNRQHHGNPKLFEDMFSAPNLGLRNDWYTDAVFSQQQFIGVNPTTITRASASWTQQFVRAATTQGNTAASQLISAASPSSLYIQDYSDYRTVTGNATGPITSDAGPDTNNHPRYGGASVVLFQLLPSGKLHPLAIILDYKGNIDPSVSVTIFNRRLNPDDTSVNQKLDWPWRYAKMCAQVADWNRHEVSVHLVRTHFIEEATIVAGQRCFPDSHIIYQLLHPHWSTTLSVNVLARQILVEQVVAPISPFKLPELFQLCHDSYFSFDWVGSYVPNDLSNRGFPVDQLGDAKFHNYAYARDVSEMWTILRKFTGSVLTGFYKGGDSDVAADTYVQAFCAEMQSPQGAGLKQFPTVTTLDALIDMVTMCIHLAAPQHTAVNYLQQYYQTFVPNKPSALYTPLPTSLEGLKKYTEADVLDSLPLHNSRNWLMMAQVPYLLSAEVEASENIVTFAKNAASDNNPLIAAAGKVLQGDLVKLDETFQRYSNDMDDQGTPYKVLFSVDLASSIVL